jgi:hypothetical protein
MKYIRQFEAYQWDPNGVGYNDEIVQFDKEYPSVDPNFKCSQCGNKLKEHGVVVGYASPPFKNKVCPTDYIVEIETGLGAVSRDLFEKLYKLDN